MLQPQLQSLGTIIPELTSSPVANIFIYGFYSVNNVMIIVLLRAVLRRVQHKEIGAFLFHSIRALPHHIFWYMGIFLLSILFQSKVVEMLVLIGIVFHWSWIMSKIEMLADSIGFFSSMEIIAEVKREK
jgi:hypothetical protein